MPPFTFQVCVVEFHHQLGPQIEFWVTPEGQQLYDHNKWSLLPFMALSDGAHAMQEDFSYFTLLNRTGVRDVKGKGKSKVEGSKFSEDLGGDGDGVDVVEGDTTLFGIACTRQIPTDQLKRHSADVTRSSVQKSVVLVTDRVRGMAELRTRLAIVTEMWFAQRDFGDVELLTGFQESLKGKRQDGEGERYFGLALREVVHEFRWQTLVLVKALLLQRKILFFGSKCERLCMLQFALLSLMPGLLSHLETSAHPSLSASSITSQSESELTPKTDARSSLLATLGLPLRIFDTGSFFSPYTPLQHLDILASYSTKSYVVGSTNSLLLQQKERYADLLVNLDEENSITILSPSLQQALRLSAADRRWIDGITQTVQDTWDEESPERPKGMGYRGSEEEIRMMFEEYILSLCSIVAYEEQESKPLDLSESTGYKGPSEDTAAPNTPSGQRPNTPLPTTTDATLSPSRYPQTISLHQDDISSATNAIDFHPPFLALWRTTHNFALFQTHLAHSRQRIFDIIEPRHPTSGALTIDDVSRRLTQGMNDLRTKYDVDERYKDGREKVEKVVGVVGERWKEGIKRVREEVERRRASGDSSADATTSADATRREKENEDNISVASSTRAGASAAGWQAALRARATNLQARASEMQKPDTAAVQAAARENAAKASAYLSSWGSWAKEKAEARRKGGGGEEGVR